MIQSNDVLFSPDLWKPALEKFTEATHLTVKIFDADQRVAFGPIHPTPMFQLFYDKGYDPGIFAECARRCMAQVPDRTNTRPAVVVSQYYGLAVVGTSLVLNGETVGAAVAGYAFLDFFQVSEVHRLAIESGIKFDNLWKLAREQKPVPQGRLIANAELLQVLGDTLLRENYRTRQHEEVAADLAIELADTQRLHETSTLLIREGKIQVLYDQILAAAMGIMRSDMATVQILDPQRGELRLLSSKGFNPKAAAFWEWVRLDSDTSCAAALRTGHRMVVPDIEACNFMSGTADYEMYCDTGIRAVQSTPLFSRAGHLLGMISTHWRSPHEPDDRHFRLMDILARQAADIIERAAGERDRAALAAIVESSDDAIVSEDLNGTIVSWNRGAETLYGYTAQEIIGKTINIVMPGDRSEEEPAILEHIAHGQSIKNFDSVRRRKDGTMLDVSLSASPIINPEGAVIGMARISRDITERNAAGRERERLLTSEQQARQEAEAANRAKDEFVAVVSHELRTPLTPILMWTHMLNANSDPSQITLAMAMIERNVKLQLRLIEDLLDTNRVARNAMNITLAKHDVSEIVRSAVEMVAGQIEKKSIALEVIQTSQSLAVQVDAVRLQQVFTNILGNAVKFTPEGGSIQVEVAGDAGDVVVKIRDTGQGIAPEFLPHVFEMFRQQEGGSRRSHSGLGIGLALVKSLLQLQGGAIEVKSDGHGFGTEVIVTLPLLSSVPKVEIPKMPAARAPLHSTLRGLSILVVEDSSDAREATEFLLIKLGAQVTSTSGGFEALEVLKNASPDLVLCDLAMPRMDGFEFFEELRQLKGALHPPVIALSGRTSTADHDQTRAAGFSEHVDKPFDETTLLAAIQRAHCAA